MIPVLSSSRPSVAAHGHDVSHNRCQTCEATIVGEFGGGEIVGATSVPTGAQLPAR